MKQDKQLGTGHAVLQAKDTFSSFRGDVMILSGNIPLLSEMSLDKNSPQTLCFMCDRNRAVNDY